MNANDPRLLTRLMPMLRIWPVALLVAAVLSGCSQDMKGLNAPSASGSEIKSGGQSDGKSAQKVDPNTPDTKESPLPNISNADKAITQRQAGAFVIKPSNELGYRSAQPEEAKNLGTDVDKALATIEPTLVKLRMELSNGDEKSSSTPEVKIQDRKNFSIGYVDPEFPYEIGLLVSNPASFAQYRDSKYVKPDTGAPKTSFNHQDVVDWFSNAGYRVFDVYRTGKGSWQTLIAALTDPKNQFNTQFDKKIQAAASGKDRPFYRVTVSSKTEDKFIGEIIIDSLKNVPVTIRSIAKQPSGREDRLFWSANWQFGGKFQPKDFEHPSASN